MARRGGGRTDARNSSGGRDGRQGGRGQQGRARDQRTSQAGRGSQGGRGRQGRGSFAPQSPRERGGRPQTGRGGRPERRETTPGDYLEGRRATEEALDLGLPIKRALVQKDGGNQDPALVRLVTRLEQDGAEVERVAKPVLDSLSSHGAHQGIVLRVQPYRYAELSDVIAAAGEGDALVIVLDHVTDEGNFGAIVRTAEVVGAAGVVVAKARAARVGVGAYKTSAGAVMHLPIAQVSNLAAALDELKEHGFWAGGATEHAHDVIWDAPIHGRLALVMGSEGNGISKLVRQHCDFEMKLPQRGRVESLNVAQATTAIAYEWLRRSMTGEGQASGSVAGADGFDAMGADFPDTSDFDFGAGFPDTLDFDLSDGDFRG